MNVPARGLGSEDTIVTVVFFFFLGMLTYGDVRLSSRLGYYVVVYPNIQMTLFMYFLSLSKRNGRVGPGTDSPYYI